MPSNKVLNWSTVLDYAKNGSPASPQRVEKTAEEWKSALSPEVFAITRQHGTERPFSSEMCHAFDPGVYLCACCGTALFDSQEKYDSGSGWPSFSQPIEDNVIHYRVDQSFGMTRVETLCSVCDAHLGHVFPDGPKPSGLRFCMNALALEKREND